MNEYNYRQKESTSQSSPKEIANAFKFHLSSVGLINDSVRNSVSSSLVKNIDEAIDVASLTMDDK